MCIEQSAVADTIPREFAVLKNIIIELARPRAAAQLCKNYKQVTAIKIKN